jgi:serine protease Do
MSALDIESLGVFQVFTGGGTGSGFLIDRHLLLTNCHVVEPYRTVAVELRDQRRILGTVRRIHPRRDLAIVELSQPLEGELLELASSDDLKPKEVVHIVGYPVGLPLSVSEGVISNPKQLFDGQHYVQTDAAINPGNSGGPILDLNKRIVAVTTCKLTMAEMVGFGIPGTDARGFVEAFRGQTAPFGVLCPSCEMLLESAERYCGNCGTDLEGCELAAYFEAQENHPLVDFVEGALAKASIDPVLARHGEWNWSFYSGSAAIQIWCCCPEHLSFSSPLVRPGKQKLGELFRYLLSPEHAPFAFGMEDDVIRLNLTFHVTDIFGQHDEAAEWIAKFVASADRYDNALAETFGCEPAPQTQLKFFKEQAAK